MKRIMIIGGPGSGKSTLGRLLADKTGLPLYHMDHIHYRPGWNERTAEEKDVLCHQVHMEDRWIFDGNHSRTFKERLQRADTLIGLDMAVSLRLTRCLWRTFKSYGQSRADLPENCPESFDLDFYRFIWRTRRHYPARTRQAIAAAPPHLTVHHFTNPNEVKNYLSHLGG
jgi:adenylate kinase family enzyme